MVIIADERYFGRYIRRWWEIFYRIKLHASYDTYRKIQNFQVYLLYLATVAAICVDSVSLQ